MRLFCLDFEFPFRRRCTNGDWHYDSDAPVVRCWPIARRRALIKVRSRDEEEKENWDRRRPRFRRRQPRSSRPNADTRTYTLHVFTRSNLQNTKNIAI